nr:uncharacterized protein LOC112028271 [Quercus suber]
MNAKLVVDFETSEVHDAIEQMAPLKAPGPDGLNGLIVQAAIRGDIKGFALCRSGPRLTHLLFADDSLLFCRATDQECSHILEILEAPECASGSYAWSNLLKGREVLWRGARWRVGNGESIKIWDYPWLPSLVHPRVLSPVIDGLHEATVNYLINPMNRSWDSDVVAGFFTPLEADLILKIPLSPTNVEDKLIWPHVPNGVYTVKSGYRFLVQEKAGPRPSHQVQADSPNIWRRIWGLSVPNKVKNFLWRACKEALPMKTNLMRRKVLAKYICCHCNLRAEDGFHALWDCAALSAIWEVDMLWLLCRSKKFSNFYELACFVLENGRNPELFAALTWTIWSQRNQLRTSNKPYPLTQVTLAAKQMLQDFKQVQLAVSIPLPWPQRQPVQWEPPPSPHLKINFDGAVFKDK